MAHRKRKKSQSLKKKGFGLRIALTALAVLFVLAATAFFTAKNVFKIKSITFEGTDRYTDEELASYIFGDMETLNSLKLGYDLKHKDKANIPFIETYEVKLEYPDKVHVILYEKSIVAYVLYKENHMYFDKDGIVVESSKNRMLDVPLVDGLEFDSIVLYSPLPVKDEGVFRTILDLSQNLQKYEIAVDKIHFNEDLSIVLYIDQVRVNLGWGNGLGEKIHELKQLEDKLAGLSGVLHMENYTEGTMSMTFKMDKKSMDKK